MSGTVCPLILRMIEALTDPKTWLFALFSILDNVPSSYLNQRQIIVSSFGFSFLQTTLLSCVDGVIEIVTIWVGVTIASRIPNSRAYVGAIFFIPNLLGVFLVNFLPWSNKIGLLFVQWIMGQCCSIIFCKSHSRAVGAHRVCIGFILALERYCRPHEEGYCQCNHAFCVLHWKCNRSFHVAS